MTNIIHNAKERRKRRTRSVLFGTGARPRISVFRSNKKIYAQAIDDEKRVTLASSMNGKDLKGTKSEQAFEVGKALGEKLVSMHVKTAISDRGSYRYHGRVKAFMDGVRAAGVIM